ncbi:MAG TPA: RNA polymerase sigma factor RpoD/SigA [bacterium]|jgi:RNA polymerase primary sigma factor|nr:RNA polymerase sigma factor RpoD/SigA [Candidatus Omnitrophota bacterium]HOJ61750.1 RNA polymerase sigma factor RpoD/SigA [bacterium]HOL96477.1 RNA polymerase sigma factor RpoD/SigA [bacterium]HPP03080.1 RNA polymerase sigma factor RpoD/SigA [bacterium]HXK92242.1 RNA polymerase sigma factor RpoD/SigA [bacterium]
MDFASLNHQIYANTQTDPLTAEEERELVRRYRQGDNEARQRLIESNLRFVIKMALNFRNKGLALADLIQDGNLGLIEALEKFDPSKNCRLITYASWWIRLYMQRAVEQKARQINLPINKTEILRKVRSFEDSYIKTHGQKPSAEEVAEALDLPVEKVEELDEYNPTFHTIHFVNEDHPGLEKVLIDEKNEDPRDRMWRNEAKDRLFAAMKVLNDREREVLSHRYSLFEGGKKLSLRKVGQKLGLSAEGVRRIEEQAMNKLRRPYVSAQMESLFAS